MSKAREKFSFTVKSRAKSVLTNTQGASNWILMSITNSLVGLLCRFRLEPIAFSCDIENVLSVSCRFRRSGLLAFFMVGWGRFHKAAVSL